MKRDAVTDRSFFLEAAKEVVKNRHKFPNYKRTARQYVRNFERLRAEDEKRLLGGWKA